MAVAALKTQYVLLASVINPRSLFLANPLVGQLTCLMGATVNLALLQNVFPVFVVDQINAPLPTT